VARPGSRENGSGEHDRHADEQQGQEPEQQSFHVGGYSSGNGSEPRETRVTVARGLCHDNEAWQMRRGNAL
jgi:hypothetical protein